MEQNTLRFPGVEAMAFDQASTDSHQLLTSQTQGKTSSTFACHQAPVVIRAEFSKSGETLTIEVNVPFNRDTSKFQGYKPEGSGAVVTLDIDNPEYVIRSPGRYRLVRSVNSVNAVYFESAFPIQPANNNSGGGAGPQGAQGAQGAQGTAGSQGVAGPSRPRTALGLVHGGAAGGSNGNSAVALAENTIMTMPVSNSRYDSAFVTQVATVAQPIGVQYEYNNNSLAITGNSESLAAIVDFDFFLRRFSGTTPNLDRVVITLEAVTNPGATPTFAVVATRTIHNQHLVPDNDNNVRVTGKLNYKFGSSSAVFVVRIKVNYTGASSAPNLYYLVANDPQGTTASTFGISIL